MDMDMGGTDMAAAMVGGGHNASAMMHEGGGGAAGTSGMVGTLDGTRMAAGAAAGAGHSMDMGGMDMGDKYHGSVTRLAGGGYAYAHGAWLGHMLPGGLFLALGTWWALSLFILFLRSRIARRPFRSRVWYGLPAGPTWLRAAPIEPILKVVLPLVGILGELWLGHESYRPLYADDGKFFTDNINDWQHSLMYGCFMTSGLVDLLGHYAGLPSATEHVFLGLAFLGQLLLLVFHLKGPQVEILLHLILALQVAATLLGVFAEALAPSSLLAACARPYFTIVQGVWWMFTAGAMYTSDPAYDPDYMGGSMMVPAVWVLQMLLVAVAMLVALVVMRFAAAKLHGRAIPWEEPAAAQQLGGGGAAATGSALMRHGMGDEVGVEAGDLEMSSLMKGSYGHV